MKTLALPFVEKEFYLDEFHDKSLMLIGRAAELTTDEEVEELGGGLSCPTHERNQGAHPAREHWG